MSEATIRDYRRQIDELTETVRQLRQERSGVLLILPAHWGLTRSQTAMLSELYRSPHGRATRPALRRAIEDVGADHGKRIDEQNVISVQMVKLRQRVAPFGIKIETVWGEGYALTPESRAIVRNTIKEQVTA